MLNRRLMALLLAAVLCAVCVCSASAAAKYRTLRVGSSGQSVTRLQQALIALGYDLEEADGHYGTQTRDAVKAFQLDHDLKVDGIAGKATQAAVYAALEALSTPTPDPQATPVITPVPEPTSIPYVVVTSRPVGAEPRSTEAPEETAAPDAASPSAAPAEAEIAETPAPTEEPSLFGGNYRLMRSGSKGARVRALQQALNDLGYDCGEVDGRYGVSTRRAVTAFQRDHGLSADGQAGKKTLQAIEDAWVRRGTAATEEKEP